jgi:hypothetical protein
MKTRHRTTCSAKTRPRTEPAQHQHQTITRRFNSRPNLDGQSIDRLPSCPRHHQPHNTRRSGRLSIVTRRMQFAKCASAGIARVTTSSSFAMAAQPPTTNSATTLQSAETWSMWPRWHGSAQRASEERRYPKLVEYLSEAKA